MYFHLSYSSNVIIQQKITWVWVGCSPQEAGGGSVCCSGAELAVQSFSWWHLGTMGLLVSVCWLLIPARGSCLGLTFSWIIYSDVLLLLLLLGFFGFFFFEKSIYSRFLVILTYSYRVTLKLFFLLSQLFSSKQIWVLSPDHGTSGLWGET